MIILFIFLMYQTEKQLGKLNNLKASEVVRENFETINSESIVSFGGWVEILMKIYKLSIPKGKRRISFYHIHKENLLLYF